MSSRRRAPKRYVADVVRVGRYPNVAWRHSLACGHHEVRKRKAPAERIGCTACLNRQQDEEAGLSVMVDLERTRLEAEAFLYEQLRKHIPDWDFELEGKVVDAEGQARVVSFQIRATPK